MLELQVQNILTQFTFLTHINLVNYYKCSNNSVNIFNKNACSYNSTMYFLIKNKSYIAIAHAVNCTQLFASPSE